MRSDDAKALEVKRLLGIPPEEPIFILRGQDAIAATVVEVWVSIASTRFEVPAEKVAGATAILRAFQAMKQQGRTKQPD